MQKCLAGAMLIFMIAGIARAQVSFEPVTPEALPEARALLRAVSRLSGRNTLSGQHNYANTQSKHSEQARFATGKQPAIWSSDFGFAANGDDAMTKRDAMIAEANRQFAAGSIIQLTWRARCPTEDEPAGLKESVPARLSDAQWPELLTADTPLRKRWEAQVDVITDYLKQLRDARIPVLWQLYPELNANSCWWSGRAGENGSAALYCQLFGRLANHHKLSNLIWVWNSNAPTDPNVGPYADFFPGRRYCDILATDVYREFKRSYHDDLAALAGGIPITLGEVGRVPSPAILKEQSGWTWFMVWADLLRMSKPERIHELFNDPNTLSRGDPLPGRD